MGEDDGGQEKWEGGAQPVRVRWETVLFRRSCMFSFTNEQNMGMKKGGKEMCDEDPGPTTECSFTVQ